MRLHPLSVPYRVANQVGRFGLGIVFGFAGLSSLPFVDSLWLVAAGALGLLALVGYEVAYHRRFEYALADTTLDVASGVLARREREIPLRRVQNVDVSQNVVQRVLGIATVRVETAGGGSTEAVLECVSAAEAERLQNELRRLKRALDDDDGARAAADADAETSEEAAETVFVLDSTALLIASALSFDARLVSVVFVAQPFVWPVVSAYVPTLVGVALAAAIAFVVLLGVVALWAVSALRTFVRYYDFRLTRTGDDLRYERGLFQRYTGTIPMEKLQTVVVRETVLQRHFGYASLAVTTAGYAPGSGPSGGSEAAVPLATRERVVSLARELEPFDPPALERPPTRARRRYLGRYALGVLAVTALAAAVNAVLIHVPLWWTPLLLLVAAPLAAHLKWLHLGADVDDAHAVTRRGFWTRRTHVVPHHRVQTLIDRRTIFQRRWGLASVTVDTAGQGGLGSGDAVAVDVDDARADSLVATISERVRAAIARRAE